MHTSGVDEAAIPASAHIGIVGYRTHNLLRRMALLFSHLVSIGINYLQIV